MEKPSGDEIKKQKPGPKVRFEDEAHKRHREANRRYYWRKKELSRVELSGVEGAKENPI